MDRKIIPITIGKRVTMNPVKLSKEEKLLFLRHNCGEYEFEFNDSVRNWLMEETELGSEIFRLGWTDIAEEFGPRKKEDFSTTSVNDAFDCLHRMVHAHKGKKKSENPLIVWIEQVN